ncbi:hypothetical protein D9619_007751 [Psilocybe cf. subviscida]|uniref:Uncharacterized protein n=1 Tax=Psilocybe cf. subviscida TaxID=2480587 RepID=A0A8H5AU49_9AGAR|nr:hypothetical protein D9619_007751 [Psilocybe cf. subviscida]
MAKVKTDSELMLHMMPAQPITSTKRFVAVRDDKARPLLFSVSTDNQFTVIRSNGKGTNVEQNLGKILGIQGAVDAFVVTQSSDAVGTLFIAVAVKTSDTSSRLYVLEPIIPSDLALPEEKLKTKLLAAVKQPTNARITQLHMNPTSSNKQPLFVVVYKDIHNAVQTSRVVTTANNWTWKDDLDIPELAKKFIAVCPGNVPIGQGLIILYEGGNKKPSLMFITTGDPSNRITVDCGFPDGVKPTSMSTFTDVKGHTGLFVAGSGLHLVTALQLSSSGSRAKKVSSDPLFQSVENLFVAQAGANLSAWFETADHSLGYQQATNDGALVGLATPLLPAGSTAEFAPIIDPTSSSQILVILNDANQLSLFEQSVNSKIWKRTLFLFQKQERLTQISAFVTHIEITDAKDAPLAKTQFILSASWVSVLINGLLCSIPSSGTTVTTDARGIITLVAPSQDMSCYKFTLKNAKGKKILPDAGVIINPAQKVINRISKIKTADDLKNLKKRSDGSGAFAGLTVSDADVKNAAKAISTMNNIASGNATISTATTASADPPKAGEFHGPELMKSVVAGSGTPNLAQTVKQAAWSFWEWITAQVQKVTNWFVSKVNDAWHFIVNIANQAWTFVIDGANAVARATGFIFSKLKVAWNTVIDCFGYIFNWDDIMKTRDSIKVMINSCFDFGSSFVFQNKAKVTKVFDNMEATIVNALANTDKRVPEAAQGQKTNPAGVDSSQPTGAAALTSAPANVGPYHFEQAQNSSSELDAATTALTNAFNKIIKPALADLFTRVGKLAADIQKLVLSAASGVSMTDILKIIGADVVSIILGLFKDIVVGLMDVAADIIQAVKSVLKWTVQIPIITPLLEGLGIPSITLIDAVSLLYAMPITVIAKILTGKPPPRIQSFDYSAMVQGTLNKNAQLAYAELGTYLEIMYYIYDTAVQTMKMTLGDITPDAVTLGSIVLKLTVLASAFPYDLTAVAWSWRIAGWSASLASEIIKAVVAKTRARNYVDLAAATDVFIALSSFYMAQIVHGQEYETNKTAAANALTSISLTKSIFVVVAGVAGGYGTLVPDPVEKGVCLVAVAAGNIAAGTLTTADKVINKTQE